MLVMKSLWSLDKQWAEALSQRSDKNLFLYGDNCNNHVEKGLKVEGSDTAKNKNWKNGHNIMTILI